MTNPEWETWFNKHGESFCIGQIVNVRLKARKGVYAQAELVLAGTSGACSGCRQDIVKGDLYGSVPRHNRAYCLNCLTVGKELDSDLRALSPAEIRKMFPKRKRTRRGKK